MSVPPSFRFLLTGGSGLIGTRLTDLLLQEGHQVAHVSRTPGSSRDVPVFQWDIHKQQLDRKAIDFAQVIVHLAGASVAGKRWTSSRRQVIRESRIASTRLLVDALQSQKHAVTAFLSASGANYYGMYPNGPVKVESDPPGNDFLSRVCVDWEAASEPLERLDIRRCLVRTGVVLSKGGGALEKLITPTKWGVGAPLGSGKQSMSWIHIDDLCRLYIFLATQSQLHGPFNGTAPYPVTNREMTRTLARVMNKPLWLPPVPAPALTLVFGEMANIILRGVRLSSEKVEAAGFSFRFNKLEPALRDLLH